MDEAQGGVEGIEVAEMVSAPKRTVRDLSLGRNSGEANRSRRAASAGNQSNKAHEGKLQLTGGFDGVSGQLEIYHNNTWGRVCGTGFGQTEVNVACYQITNGTVRKGRRVVVGYYSQIDFLLDGVKCQAGDTRLEDCVHNPWGEHTCSGADNVFISCSEALAYRLEEKSGRLEVYHDGQWYAICSNNFWRDEARTACETLGLQSKYNGVNRSVPLPKHGRMWSKEVDCNSTTDHLNKCRISLRRHFHKACNPVLLSCGDINKTTDEIVLKGPGSGQLGRIFVRHMGGLGRVCMKKASVEVAMVACRSLGLPVENAVLLSDDLFRYAKEDHLFNFVSCEGTEASLFDCSYTSLSYHYCVRPNRLSVACWGSAGSGYSLRLTRGEIDTRPGGETDSRSGGETKTRSGILQMRYYGTWGNVCGQNYGTTLAKVACRELGLPWGGAEFVYSVRNYYKSDDRMTWLDFEETSCNGDETSLEACGKIFLVNGCLGSQIVPEIRCKPSEWTTPYYVGSIVGGVVSVVIALIVAAIVIQIVKRRSRPSCAGQQLQTLGNHEVAESRPPQPAQYPVSGSPNPTY